jgi:hypothetical protein
MMAVTQTVCWALGFKEMACIVGSWPSDNPDEKARTSISKELTESIQNAYPYMFDRRAKKHSVVQAVEYVYDCVSGSYRYVSLPDAVKREYGISGLYNPNYDVKNDIAQFILYCSQLQ